MRNTASTEFSWAQGEIEVNDFNRRQTDTGVSM